MATFKVYYNPYNAKKDGRFTISIKLYHNKRQVYLNTGLTASEKDIGKDGQLKPSVLKAAYKILDLFEERYRSVAIIAETLSAKELAMKIQIDPSKSDRINVYQFIEDKIKELLIEGRDGNAATYRTCLNSLRRFRPSLYFDEITYQLIKDYEHFLLSNAGSVTVVIKGKEFERPKRAISNNSISTYMAKFNSVFNDIIKKHSDNPSFTYRNPWINYSRPRIKDIPDRDLPIELLRKIVKIDTSGLKYGIWIDIFKLSLFFCGINMSDLFNNARIVNGRLEFNRQKTARKRSDNAFSSIMVQPEAQGLIDKYVIDGRFKFAHYTDHTKLGSMMRWGLTELEKMLKTDIHITYYSARHSVATIMSNDLDIPDSTVKMCLNHDQKLGVTGGYIKKDFSKIDRANRKFLDYLFADEYLM